MKNKCNFAYKYIQVTFFLIVTYKEKSERTQLLEMKMNGSWGETKRRRRRVKMDGWMCVGEIELWVGVQWTGKNIYDPTSKRQSKSLKQ